MGRRINWSKAIAFFLVSFFIFLHPKFYDPTYVCKLLSYWTNYGSVLLV